MLPKWVRLLISFAVAYLLMINHALHEGDGWDVKQLEETRHWYEKIFCNSHNDVHPRTATSANYPICGSLDGLHARSLKQIVSSRTIPLESLWLMYTTIPRSQGTLFREVSYALARRSSVPYTDITLVTQLSTDKLHRLPQILVTWNGPISCAVHLPSEASIQELFLFVLEQNEIFHEFITLHVMLERLPPNSAYPINRLRNLALDNIDTECFFYMDVDFMPSTGMHDYLKDIFSRVEAWKKYSTLYVIPAFEMVGGIKDNNLAPGTKRDLLEMISLKRAKGFHMDFFRPGHNSTNFDHWYKCHGLERYPIQYQYMFEPYIVGSNHALHRFDHRLRGYGLNKWVWVAEASLRGYNFEVLCGAFVVHMAHKYDSPRRLSRDVEQLQQWYERIYWPGRYGRADFGRSGMKSTRTPDLAQ